jgi:UDP-glucose 4-epimerase
MTRKIVVTGGCGYIGSHVARAFKMNGDNVIVIDRVKREHALKDLDGFFISDFADDDALATIYDYQPDVIVHCAGTSLVGPSMSDPGEYYDNNISKTIRLLNFVKNFDKKPFIMFSSSASVYGEPDQLPITEHARKNPISPYGNTKSMTEEILKDYWGAYALPSMCFRYFNAAGAMPGTADLGQEPEATHIVARVLEASLANRAFTINGGDFLTPDGTCIRDYVHVWDIAQAHVKGVEYAWPTWLHGIPNVGASVFNLGTNVGVSNKQIVDYVFDKYGLPFVNYGPTRWGDPAELVADATEAREKLRWAPEYSDIETIIDSAYIWYTNH